MKFLLHIEAIRFLQTNNINNKFSWQKANCTRMHWGYMVIYSALDCTTCCTMTIPPLVYMVLLQCLILPYSLHHSPHQLETPTLSTTPPISWRPLLPPPLPPSVEDPYSPPPLPHQLETKQDVPTSSWPLAAFYIILFILYIFLVAKTTNTVFFYSQANSRMTVLRFEACALDNWYNWQKLK